jgi:hypothetical protein
MYGEATQRNANALEMETVVSPKLWYSTWEQTMPFVYYISSWLEEGKQTHVLCQQKTLPQTASYKVLPLRNNVYILDSICFIICCPSHPSDPLATCEISGSHGVEHEDGCLLGGCTL